MARTPGAPLAGFTAGGDFSPRPEGAMTEQHTETRKRESKRRGRLNGARAAGAAGRSRERPGRGRRMRAPAPARRARQYSKTKRTVPTVQVSFETNAT